MPSPAARAPPRRSAASTCCNNGVRPPCYTLWLLRVVQRLAGDAEVDALDDHPSQRADGQLREAVAVEADVGRHRDVDAGQVVQQHLDAAALRRDVEQLERVVD